MTKAKAARGLFDALCDLLEECDNRSGTRAREAVDEAGEALRPGIREIADGDVVGGIARIVTAHRDRARKTSTALVAPGGGAGLSKFFVLGERDESYPPEVRALDGKSGVYVIREKGGAVVYVGESHTGNLYGTLTRHFQAWSRHKAFWTKAGFSEHDPGVTYDRGKHSVAFRVTRDDAAYDLQNELIDRLRPRDNVTGKKRDDGDDDVLPF